MDETCIRKKWPGESAAGRAVDRRMKLLPITPKGKVDAFYRNRDAAAVSKRRRE